MRFRILGDHSDLHAGCVAVMSALRAVLRNHGEVVSEGEPYDTLVMNGEGSMHHSSAHWRGKMEAIDAAQAEGKKTFLVNSVWQENGDRFDAVLRDLDGVWLRGPLSARDLLERHGVDASWALDLSYFAPLDDVPPAFDCGGEIATTDVWSPTLMTFVKPTAGLLSKYIYIDMALMDWSTLVATLKTCRLLIAGRHHAMYAACRARTAFVAVAGNSHKFEDLLAQSASVIPVCNTISEIRAASGAAERRPAEYRELFDWMDRRPAWDFPSTGLARSVSLTKEPELSIRLARAAATKGDHKGSLQYVTRAQDLGAKTNWLATQKVKALARSGMLVEASLLATKARFAGTLRMSDFREIDQAVTREELWKFAAAVDGAPSWWNASLRALDLVQPDDREASLAGIREALESTEDSLAYEACKALLLARLSACRDWDIAEAVERLPYSPELSPRALAYQRARFFARRVLVDEEALEQTRAVLQQDYPELDADARAELRDYLWRSGHLDEGLLGDAAKWANRSAREAAQAVSMSLQLHGLRAAVDMMRRFPKASQHTVDTLSVARVAAEIDSGGDHALAKAIFDDGFESGRRMADMLGGVDEHTAFVGNGRIVGAGKAIDRHDTVVRFNDFRLVPSTVTDIGSKVDFIATVNHQRIGFGQQHTAKARHGVMLCHPLLAWQPTNLTSLRTEHRKNRRFGFMPDTIRNDLQLQLGATPSTGLHVLSLAHHMGGRIALDSLFGFTLLSGNPSGARQHGKPAHFRHNWSREAGFLDQLVTDDGAISSPAS